MSLISAEDSNLQPATDIGRELSRYFLSGAIYIQGTPFEEVLLGTFDLLARMKQQSKNPANSSHQELKYRYQHTLLMLEQFSAVFRHDEKHFIRLDQKALSRGESMLTAEQFDRISERFREVLNSPKSRMIMSSMIIFHDYGCLYDFPTHFVVSGRVCKNEAQKVGLNAHSRLIELVVGNHSYLGDLLLGEASLDHADYLLEQAKQANLDLERFWKYLWLLNLLDINAAKGGFLSSAKYRDLDPLYNSKDVLDLKENYLSLRLRYLFGGDKAARMIEADLIDPGFIDVYSQYLHLLINQQTFTLQEQVRLINILTEFWLEAKKQLNFRYIAFSSDSMQASRQIIRAMENHDNNDIFSIDKAIILGFNFRIENDYLRIDLGKRY